LDTSEEISFRGFISHLHSSTDEPVSTTPAGEHLLTTHPVEFPIIEGNVAHFIHQGRPGTIAGVIGDWNGWDVRRAVMTPIGHGLLHYQHEFEEDARLDYFFYEVDADKLQDLPFEQAIVRAPIHSMRDPLNPRVGESGFGMKSELAMPGYQRPAATLGQVGTTPGTLHKGTITSKVLDQERSYTVYLPVGYSTNEKPYPSIYFKDGGDYLKLGKAPTILDNLIDMGVISPVVAVFIPPVERTKEYNCGDEYVQFFCEELIPQMHDHYNLSTDPAKRAVMGPSLGGLISLYIGSQRPDLFGLIGAQSSAVHSVYGLDKYDARIAYAVSPRLPLRLHLVIGTYEGCFDIDKRGRCQDLLNPVRDFRSVLEQSGYAYRYAEHHQGHSWGMWRDTLVDALTYFFAED
jgi:enterochelin esterase-like enzyme